MLRTLKKENPEYLEQMREEWTEAQKKKGRRNFNEKPRITADILLEALEQVDLMEDRLQKLAVGFQGEMPETKDIIIVSFIEAYSNMEQLIGNNGIGVPEASSYPRNNAEREIRILQNTAPVVAEYDLTEGEVQLMKSKLFNARLRMEKILANKPASLAPVDVAATNGGIDLNPANQNLVIQGKGNDFVLPGKLNNIDAAQVSGFVPEVESIKPIFDLHKILGIQSI